MGIKGKKLQGTVSKIQIVVIVFGSVVVFVADQATAFLACRSRQGISYDFLKVQAMLES